MYDRTFQSICMKEHLHICKQHAELITRYCFFYTEKSLNPWQVSINHIVLLEHQVQP